MRKLLSVALLMGMILSCNEAKGADWKFWGSSTSAKAEKVLLYYDTESLEHLSGGNIKVWTKAIKQTDIEKAIAKKDKQIKKAAAKKFATGYLPPYLLGDSGDDKDVYLEMIAWEQAANRSDIPANIRILYELNCNEKKLRTLSGTAYSKNGSEPKSHTDDNSQWTYISPETNAETLGKILCRGKK